MLFSFPVSVSGLMVFGLKQSGIFNVVTRAFSMFLVCIIGLSVHATDSVTTDASEDSGARVVLIGHLYSLLVEKHSREAAKFNVDKHLKVLVDEVELLQADAVFLLGDITNNAKPDEWDAIQRAFANQAAPLYTTPGNHDLTAGLEGFLSLGGEGSRSVVVGQTKFILLGSESFPNALPNDELPTFISKELEDHKDYQDVVVLMHFLLKGNAFWEREIVPLLKGRVKHVFTGDLVSQHMKAQKDNANDILYASSSIKFKGEGPAVFIVVEQTSSGLRATPRALPLELTNTWYIDHKDTETSTDRYKRILKRVPAKVVVAFLVLASIVGILSLLGLRSLFSRKRS